MKLEEAAFINLVVMARADGVVTGSEEDMLEKYRESLGLTEEFAKGLLDRDDLRTVPMKNLAGKPEDRRQVLKMMIRIAHIDGRVSSRERQRVQRMANTFGFGKLALKALFLEIEQELGIRRRLRRSQLVAAVTIVVAAAIVWFAIDHFSAEADKHLSDAKIDIERLKQDLTFDRAQAAEALENVKASQLALDEKESELEKRLAELDVKGTAERNTLKETLTEAQKTREKQLQGEVTRLREELARIRTLNAVFKDIEKEYGGSILLLYTSYDLVLGPNRIPRGSMGSGCFVSTTGHLVTNKHVVQPWKFSAEEIMLQDAGYAVDENSLRRAAWPAGATVKNAAGELSFDKAYTSEKKTLALYRATPDTFETMTRQLGTGMIFKGRFHTHDHGDLAVLKAETTEPVKPLPLALVREKIEKLDPVMVLGFPTGINILEATTAETSPSLGEVRKIEKSILVTAPIVPGNSGGPLIDAMGRVVGVASGSWGEATLGSCIPVSHVFALVPEASELVKTAETHEKDKAFRAALDDLRLAEGRTEKKDQLESIAAIRGRLLKLRDDEVKKAESLTEPTGRKKALEEVVKRFGPHWTPRAVDLLEKM